MPDPKNPQKKTSDDSEREDPRGSEVIADAQRTDDDLPRVHGHGWNEDEPRDGREMIDNKEDPDPDAPEGDEAIDDPGTRGAVFGKGGRGLVERDNDDDGGPKKG